MTPEHLCSNIFWLLIAKRYDNVFGRVLRYVHKTPVSAIRFLNNVYSRCPISVHALIYVECNNHLHSVAQHGALKLTFKRNKLTLAVRFAKINSFINAKASDVFRLGAVTHHRNIHKAF